MNKMFTGNDGVSYYKTGKRYFKNTGWREVEITQEDYEKNVERILGEIRTSKPKKSIKEIYGGE